MSSVNTPRITEIDDKTSDDIGMSIEINSLIPFINQTQSAGALTLVDAFALNAALRYLLNGTEEAKDDLLSQFSDESKGKRTVEDLASNVIITALVRGQSRGAYNLSDAAKLAKMLKLVK